MKGRTPTKEEKAWLDAICQIGCIVCRNEFNLFSPACPHHIDGKTKPGRITRQFRYAAYIIRQAAKAWHFTQQERKPGKRVTALKRLY